MRLMFSDGPKSVATFVEIYDRDSGEVVAQIRSALIEPILARYEDRPAELYTTHVTGELVVLKKPFDWINTTIWGVRIKDGNEVVEYTTCEVPPTNPCQIEISLLEKTPASSGGGFGGIG